MKTFLELCRDLGREAGVSGWEDLVSVVNQQGEFGDIVAWIAKAYEYVQNARPLWKFLFSEWTFPTIAGTSAYSKSSTGLTEIKTWSLDSFRCYKQSLGTDDEQFLTPVPYREFKDVYLFGANRNVTGRPSLFTVKPDNSLVLWPTPDDVYVVEGEAQIRPQVMTQNDDTPIFPGQFADVLVWKGLMFYAAEEAAPELYANGEREFGVVFGKLEADQHPPMQMAAPLA